MGNNQSIKTYETKENKIMTTTIKKINKEFCEFAKEHGVDINKNKLHEEILKLHNIKIKKPKYSYSEIGQILYDKGRTKRLYTRQDIYKVIKKETK